MKKYTLEEAARIIGGNGGRIGGKSKSPAKLAAIKENGKKGGRPRGRKSDLSKLPEAIRTFLIL